MNEASKKEFLRFFQQSTQPMLLLCQQRVRHINSAAREFLNLPVELGDGQSVTQLFEQNGNQHILPVIREFLANGGGQAKLKIKQNGLGHVKAQFYCSTVNLGEEALIHVGISPIGVSAPSADQVLSLYSQIYEASTEPVMIVDQDDQIQFVNNAFCEMTGFSTKALLGKSASVLRPARHTSEFNQQIRQQLNQEGSWSGELWSLNHSGQAFPRHVRLRNIVDEEGQPVYIVGVYTDLSSQRSRLQRLQEMAYHDELTGLANRSLLMQIIPHQINQCRRDNSGFGLMFLDLDKFKQVNDSLGHEAGDILLKAAAQRLMNVLRSTDTVARLGGDEFIVLASQVSENEDLVRVADKIVDVLSKPFKIKDRDVEVGVSIGISLFPQNSDDGESLMHLADIAMYRAKKQQKGSYVFYCEEINQELVSYRQLENDIRRGLKLKEFIPYFQPQVDSRTNKIVGVECLARWQHRNRGILAPSEFIRVAERSGLIQEVFLQVLENTIEHVVAWKKELGVEVQVSVNLSGHQFANQQNIEQMSEMMRASGISPNALKTEITETSLLDSGHYLLERLSWVKSAGFRIALDDFGSGYSSLRQLRILPVDSLKIDSSFVMNMEQEPGDKVIIKAIIQLSKLLDVDVVAQGVEKPEQVQFLEENGCHIMQGFHFSRPVPAEQLTGLLRRQSD
ncbi:EAL domain-containing protein [Aliiglaciecola sp. CAU 1673]|uniref:putative bifunctional diguanylate cyclase/phosphodiesterase n=1 Tax=Aliiglaciecola sp. CAU 1673 TaxID=3032595 RepID=UPI0023DCAC84|nr:EAL domain-containing protein [Aliiglaciecola sp. CAU 1673]MDF2177229.1 EAL domain-containing protein [Aliiglaciecola sp. CAU 1673]